MIKDEPAFNVDDQVRIKKPRSSRLWSIEKRRLSDKHWLYTLKNPDDEKDRYEAGRWVEEEDLKSAKEPSLSES